MNCRVTSQPVLVTFSLMLLALRVSHAQLATNWIAYNDHRAGPAIPPHTPVQTNWGTAVRSTSYDMGAPADTIGATLTNFLDGKPVPATMTVTRTGNPLNFGTASPPLTNTPAHRAFFGKVDLSNFGIVGVDAGITNLLITDPTTGHVTFTFGALNPAKRYLFRGTATRAGGYASRWSVATILAREYVDAHESGPGSPGVLTSNQYPEDLGGGQAAWNSGDNVEGDLIGWDYVEPFADGSFSLVVSQYVGRIPLGAGSAADPSVGYSFGAILLAEVEAFKPRIETQPVPLTTVEQSRPFSLSVTSSGSPLLSYRWYKQGSGEIAGATSQVYSVTQAMLNATGDYYAIVRNPLGSATSTVARVTVEPDTTPPRMATVFSYPAFDRTTLTAALNQVIVDFNEPIDPASAGSVSQYSISNVGQPASVNVTGDRTVQLTLSANLAEDTNYNLNLTGIRDSFGNNITNQSATFRTWMRSPANGLLFEAFRTGWDVDLSTLTNHPNFPHNAFEREILWAFETRIVFPDDSHDEYGGRLRGIFIPPVTGDWLFFFRTYDRGELYLNPTGLDPLGKVSVLVQGPPGGEPRNWIKSISQPYRLNAGQACYIEGLYQAAAGSDVMKVAARPVGTGVPVPVDTPIAEIDTNAMGGAWIGFPYAPRNLGGPLTMVEDLADVTVKVNQTAIFSVVVSNQFDLPVWYEWTRNGTVIEGANGALYTAPATAADQNAIYQVRAAKMGSDPILSRAAHLHVLPNEDGSELSVSRSGSLVIVGWPDQAHQLERASTVEGPWAPVTGATSPYISRASERQAFYRLLKP